MLTGLLIFLLTVVALLAIPLVLEFRIEWPDGTNNEMVLVWALGLVRARIRTKGSEPTSIGKPTSTDSRKRGRGKSMNVMAAVRHQPFRKRLYRFFSDLWRSVSKENIRIRTRIGLSDPADTGKLWAIVGPISGMVAGVRGVSFIIAPDFADETFVVDSRGRLQLVPLRIIIVVTGLLFSPVIWRGFRTMRIS